MMYYKLKTNTRTLFIEEMEDGDLFITDNGKKSIKFPGRFINQAGGKEALLAKSEKICGDMKEGIKAERRRLAEEEAAKRQRLAARMDAEHEMARAEYKALCENNDAIEVTWDNLRIVMSFLNTMDSGRWVLPTLTIGDSPIGYSANQHDFGCHITTTIKFDRPVTLGDITETRFFYGGGVKYFPHHQRVR